MPAVRMIRDTARAQARLQVLGFRSASDFRSWITWVSKQASIEGIEITCEFLENGRPGVWERSFENTAFSIEIADGKAVFRFKEPVYALSAAEQRVMEFLRSWEGDRLLQCDSVHREFRVVSTYAPALGGRFYGPIANVSFGGPVAEANTRRFTPWRRHRYYAIPLIASLIERYESYRNGREKLAVTAYLCLSALEATFGDREEVSKACRIHRKVLSKLGELVSAVGTYSSARKIGSSHQLRELTGNEAYWIQRVLHELIRRAGEVLSGRGDFELLVLSDLPPL